MDNKMQELREIESQRSDILAKLSKIEEKKTSVSDKVYAKVRKEYEVKLNELEKKIQLHVSGNGAFRFHDCFGKYRPSAERRYITAK